MDDEDSEPTMEDDIAHEEHTKHTVKQVSKMEVLAQSFVLLIAGYETTATTLHFALYFLAKFPEVQRKVQDEIEQVVGESVRNPLLTLLNNCFQEHVAYEHVTNMPYLSQVIYETLRICPPAPQYVRLDSNYSNSFAPKQSLYFTFQD